MSKSPTPLESVVSHVVNTYHTGKNKWLRVLLLDVLKSKGREFVARELAIAQMKYEKDTPVSG